MAGTTFATKGLSSVMHNLRPSSGIFALPAGGEYRWWGRYMEEGAFERLIREIEVEKGKREGHEAVCAERYRAIEKRFEDFGKKLDIVINQALENNKSLDGWKMWALMGVFAVILGIAAWSTGQVYAIQMHRLDSVQQQQR